MFSYMWELVFLRFKVKDSKFGWLGFFTFGGWGFLFLGFRDCYVWGFKHSHVLGG